MRALRISFIARKDTDLPATPVRQVIQADCVSLDRRSSVVRDRSLAERFAAVVTETGGYCRNVAAVTTGRLLQRFATVFAIASIRIVG